MDPEEAPAPDREPPRRRRWWRWVWYSLLLIGGAVAVGLFIDRFGVRQIGSALRHALPWLPLLIVLEATWIGADTLVWRAFLGSARARSIPLRVWLRSSLNAYVVMIILPAGRAGAEVARAIGFAPYVGRAAASAGCVHTLGAGLVGNALISVPCAVAAGITVGWSHPLTWLIAVNGGVAAAMGAGALIAPRKIGFGRLIGHRNQQLLAGGELFDGLWRRSPFLTARAILWSGLGRGVQTMMLATILLALGEAVEPWRVLMAEGIYLVSAAMGDFAPNQIGVTEGVFVMFGNRLTLLHAGSALAIALVIRTIQFTTAALCLTGAVLLRRPPAGPGGPAGPGPVDAGPAG